ncbi:MAG TPA: transcription termination factor Rho [Tepidisphaeraceae bacterium]|nr:transcription termination factor Rho [Tepidisphaeraceae bacterium]
MSGASVQGARPPILGVLHIPDERKDGHLRDPLNMLRPVPGNILVPRAMWAELHLRPGLLLSVETQGNRASKILSVEGEDPTSFSEKKAIYDSTALDPAPQIKLEHDPNEFTTRAIDILTPIGFGQRGLIISPPRVGKTILMQNIARGIKANYPDAELLLLLVDERPEEVTDMRRNVPGVVHASSNDNSLDKHLELSQLVIERCKRRVEYGHDVIVLMDSLTRCGRAFNADARSGKTLSGGVDSRALEVPKRLFGAARKLEEGGSLTIIATCLVDTGSKMDQVIFEEFKGTGNMELTLDRKLADHRIFPAINIASSGTRKEELLLSPKALECNRRLRKHLVGMQPQQAMKSLLDALAKMKTNEQLYDSMVKS